MGEDSTEKIGTKGWWGMGARSQPLGKEEGMQVGRLEVKKEAGPWHEQGKVGPGRSGNPVYDQHPIYEQRPHI